MHGAHQCKMMCVASLDVNTAFDVAKPEVIAEILGRRGRYTDGLSWRWWRT